MVCFSIGHGASRCENVVSPSQNKACSWCFLQYVYGEEIDEGYSGLKMNIKQRITVLFMLSPRWHWPVEKIRTCVKKK